MVATGGGPLEGGKSCLVYRAVRHLWLGRLAEWRRGNDLIILLTVTYGAIALTGGFLEARTLSTSSGDLQEEEQKY